MSKRTVFTELSVCETLIMRQIWAYEGDIPVQTLIVKLNEEYGKNYARTTVVTFLSKLDRKSTRLNSSHVKRSRMPSSA